MIFNKNGAGAAEFKELIGFIYKSINFPNMITYIGFAERDVRKVIGKDVFDQAEQHYQSSNYDYSGEGPSYDYWLTLDDLVKKVQLPVALFAYFRYVQSADLSHSDKGRQIFVSEQEKPAFEWMIHKDNENLMSLAHEAMDVLLEFLDEHIDDIVDEEYVTGEEGEEGGLEEDLSKNEKLPTVIYSAGNILLKWGESEEYKVSKSLFINTAEEFDLVFPINRSRLTFLSLVPFLKRVQENEIRSCLTSDQYDDLKEVILDQDETPEDKKLLGKICQPLALLTMSVAVKRLSSQLLPDGIFQHLVTNVVNGRSPATKVDRNEISELLARDGARELQQLQEYLRKISLATSGGTYEMEYPSDRIDETQKFVRL